MSDQAPHHLSHLLQRDLSERCYEWLESIAEACVVLDAALVVRYCNPAFAAVWGRAAAELLGTNLPEALPSFVGSDCQQLCEQALLAGCRKDGDTRIFERWFQVRVHPVPGGVMALMTEAPPRRSSEGDLANSDQRRAEIEQVRLQEQLHHAQKLESLDVLVGGVAHDFNNLLAGILNGAELLLRELPEGSPLRESADMICKAGSRARDVARQMLVFVGKGRSARRSFDLNLLLKDNLHLLESAYPGRMHTLADLRPNLPFVHADAGQMQQVAMNLLVNATEALPPTGGTVRVTTGLAEAAEAGLADAEPLTAFSYVFVEIADDGQGMSPEVQARIFEPFFTTKPSGHGLGLAAVKNILRAHNGVIRLTSTPGVGTTFRLYLPAYQPARTPDGGTVSAGLAAPTGEVLIVDDEAFVRDIVGRMLHNAGYASRTAGSGAEALAAVRAFSSITLVVLDLKMPVMDGLATLRKLVEVRPHLKAILTSGCSPDELPQADDTRLIGFLPKPYVLEHLLKMVQKGFAGAAQP